MCTEFQTPELIFIGWSDWSGVCLMLVHSLKQRSELWSGSSRSCVGPVAGKLFHEDRLLTSTAESSIYRVRYVE